MPRPSQVAGDKKANAPRGGRGGSKLGEVGHKSTFDVDAFMSTQTTAKASTERLRVPIGEWKAQIFDMKVDSFDITKGDRKGDKLHKLTLIWKSADPDWLKAYQDDNEDPALDDARLMVRQQIILDFTEEGALDFSKGHNIKLAYLREAVGQNDGSPWAPGMLKNQTAFIEVVNVPNENEPDNPYTEVKKVSAP